MSPRVAPIGKLNSAIAKPFRMLSEWTPMKKIADCYQEDFAKFGAAVAMASVLSKDTLGCYLYVTQSLKNEKIPKEKRGFVAMLDMTNGVLMIASQIAAFYTISNEKVQKFIFDNTLGHLFNNANRKNTRKMVETTGSLSGVSKQVFNQKFAHFEKTCRGAFKVFLPLVGATIIAKRMLVPFVATPAAAWAKKHILHDEDNPIKDAHKIYHSNIAKQTTFPVVYERFKTHIDDIID